MFVFLAGFYYCQKLLLPVSPGKLASSFARVIHSLVLTVALIVALLMASVPLFSPFVLLPISQEVNLCLFSNRLLNLNILNLGGFGFMNVNPFRQRLSSLGRRNPTPHPRSPSIWFRRNLNKNATHTLPRNDTCTYTITSTTMYLDQESCNTALWTIPRI